MKLAHKLSLALVATVLGVFGISGSLWVAREARLAREEASDHLVTMGQAIRPALVHTWTTQGRAAALELLRYADERFQARGNVTIRWVALEAAPGLDAAAIERLRRGEPVAPTPEGPTDAVMTWVPVRAEGVPPGALELTRAEDQDRAFVARATRSIVLGVLAIALLLVVAVLAAVDRLVGGPLQLLTAQAHRVAGGDLSARTHLEPRSDLGRVAAEMNAMCERLVEAGQAAEAEHAVQLATLEQLRHADRLATVGQLAAGVAHELGTPLNVVIGRARLIASGQEQGGAARHSAHIIAGQGERMVQIIRQLLSFARRQAGPKVRGNVAPIVRQTVSMLETMAKKRGVQLQLDEPLAGDEVVVEVNQLEQALSNLIVNGIQATPEGGTITVGTRREHARPPAGSGQAEGEYLCMEVRDQGAGIPDQHLAHVFDPFFTTKPVGEGTGLGLSVAYGIARDHGGWIDVTSNQARGSRFSIHLPLEEARP
jgi:two-component system NtrC family sensor kinase